MHTITPNYIVSYDTKYFKFFTKLFTIQYTQYVLYEVEGLLEGDSITVNGNNGWKNVSDSGAYTLSINDDNYEANSVSGNIIILQAEAKVEFNIPEGTVFYEDRITSNDIISLASTSVPGTIILETELVYRGTDSTSSIPVSYIFEPDEEYSENFKSSDGNVTITLSPVAYIGSKYYGTVEKALDAANAGEIVYVIVGSNPIIKEDTMIKANVTLMMQYKQGKGNNNGVAEATPPSDSNYGYFFGDVTTELTIASNVTLTNNGTIEIGGRLTGSGGGFMAGHTVEKYTQIMLDSNAKIKSTGTINCYGYIKEKTKNNSSLVLLESGQIYMPFILRDYQGGSYMKAVYDIMESESVSAFNEFIFANVTTKIRINYNAKMKAWANLTTSFGTSSDVVGFVGNDDGYLIQFTDSLNSYLEAKYDEESQILDLDIYGGAKTNHMVITIKASFLSGTSVSTEPVYFPLSWQYDVSLNPNRETKQKNAIYSINQKFKVMTGAKLTIEKGATLNANNLIVYSNFNQHIEGSTVPVKYPNDKPAGQLIVNGELIADKLAGTVTTNGSGAVLQVISGTSLTSKEILITSGSLLSSKVEDTISITEELNGYLITEENEQSTTAPMTTGKYWSKNGSWCQQQENIEYTIDFYIKDIDNTESDFEKVESISFNSSMSSITIEGYELEGYEFYGWFEDESLSGSMINPKTYTYSEVMSLFIIGENNISLYGFITEAKYYDIVLEYYKGDGLIENINPTTETIKATAGTEIDLSNYVNSVTKIGYELIGWIDEETGEKYPENHKVIVESSMKIKADYEIKTYTISFDLNGGSGSISPITAEYGSAITKPSNPTRNKYKFTDWDPKFPDTMPGNDLTLVAQWEEDSSCVAEGTMITMADGSYKPVEDIVPGDKVLVYNHENGCYDVSVVMLNAHAELKYDYYTIINLVFDDGTKLKIINEHTLFNTSINKYVIINQENYRDFIDDTFYATQLKENQFVRSDKKLVDSYISVEYTRIFNPLTYYHMNSFTDGLLSMPGEIDGLINIFDYDNNLMYTEESMTNNIEKYGIYSYEDVQSDYSLEIYNSLPLAYVKIQVEKGKITYEEVKKLIYMYSEQINNFN